QPNAVLHTRDEEPPFTPLYEALHRLRLLSAMLGAGCVLATFALARAVFPRRPALAPGAAAFTATLPQFVFPTALFHNDSPTFLLCSLAAVPLARIVAGRSTSLGEHLRLGGLFGLGLLTKVNVIALVAVSLAALAWATWRSTDRRERLLGLLACATAVALV